MDALEQFIQANSPDGGLLQSEAWRTFQQSVGHDTVTIDRNGFFASAFVHELPIVGNYLYVPRGPVVGRGSTIGAQQDIRSGMEELIESAREKRANWIRIEPADDDALSSMREVCDEFRVLGAPRDVQPREIFRIDLSPSEGELIAAMKQKTRYNIRLAEKKGVQVLATGEARYREAFIRLVREMAMRKRLTPHPEAYYRKMLDAFVGRGGILYVAVHGDDVLAASLVVSYGDTAAYLHGGLGEAKRELMAPYLLQWEAIKAAKLAGRAWYDFGGINKEEFDAGRTEGKWHGITKFKFGFAPDGTVVRYPGSYDIVLEPMKYRLYEKLHLVRENYVYLRKFMGL